MTRATRWSAVVGAVVVAAASLAHADYMDHFVVPDDIGPHKAPSLGEAKLLLMPVEVKGFAPIDTEALQRFFSPDDANGFVHYYETASLGRYRPRVVVGPKITFDSCPLPADKFPKCRVPRGDLNAFTAGMNMIRDVVARTRDAGVDFSQFDVNGRKGTADGYIDGLMLLTNVPFGGIAFPFGYFNRDDNLNGGTGGPLVVNGIKITHVAIAGESDRFVMVHEFGHLLGLTDLYSQADTYDGLYLSQMGAWFYDEKIPLPDAETRLRLRWSNWRQIQGRQRVVIQPVETSGEIFKVGIGPEYFLIENRGAGQFDRFIGTRGLAVFHVNRAIKLKGEEGEFVSRILDGVNDDPFKPYIQLLQADGRFDIENGKEFSDADDLFRAGSQLKADPSGEPMSKTHQVLSSNLQSGAPSGFALNDARLLSDGSIEVTLDGPADGQCGDSLCAAGDGCQPLSCGPYADPKKSCAVAPESAAAVLALAMLWRRRVKLQRV